MNPAISYVIASVERSGTHLLCSILRSTGIVGVAGGVFFVQARRNLGKTLGRAIARRLCAPHLTAKYRSGWSLRHGCNVELFRTNAPDVAGNSRIQKS